MKWIIFLFLFNVLFSFGQTGGENTYQFLNLSTSARQIALGGEVNTIIGDINQPIWNPATITDDIDGKLALNYSNYLSDINIGSLSYAKNISRRLGMLYGNISYLNYGNFIGADEFGNETGSFSANDLALTIGYSYNIPRSDFYIGMNLKFISSNIENFNSYGVATDVAVLYRNRDYPFVITLVARNIGKQLKSYNGTQETLPFKVALGGSYKLAHVPLKWYGTIDNLEQWEIAVPNPSEQTTDLEGNVTEEDITVFDNIFRRMVIGAELFPDKIINLRAGYNFRRSSELKLQNARSFSGISFGFGIRMNKFKFNYAYSNYHAATNTSTFSLEIDLDNRY
ncbi:type IX secretion system protein PorQ [Polaribacter sp.]|nr:type IX secretion system protein PorQ [Polaribacter sp.]